MLRSLLLVMARNQPQPPRGGVPGAAPGVHQVTPLVLLQQTVLTRILLGEVNCDAGSEYCAQNHDVCNGYSGLRLGLNINRES